MEHKRYQCLSSQARGCDYPIIKLFLVYIMNHCSNVVCIGEEKGQIEILQKGIGGPEVD